MKRSSVVVRMGLGAALVLGAGACASRQQVAESAPSSPRGAENLSAYYPLAVGNQWTYRINGRTDKTVTVEIVKEEGGYFHDNQGGQLSVDTFGVRDLKRYLLRGPLTEGNQWTNVVSVSSTEHYRILQANVPCETAAGGFASCVRVEARNRVDAETTLINAITFAEGVGLVRLDLSVERGSGERVPQTSLELASYQLKDSGR
ncbi:hypothetical protein [Melittangium boletus]|uniref:Lipoprotein n=1 Tax=Melittangium boletus DSM 14713 TaxID=1294270 RepID=A0A250IM61_9BACT|nr:hypothetical protein [Melittangium boletus]ATB32839.1 hypothetical protein MEBOL_006328 [Melittangium boletus DSM 14713]